MRRNFLLTVVLLLLVLALAVPALASPPGAVHVIGQCLAGPDVLMQVPGSSGIAKLNDNGVAITIKATGLEPGHAVTMWIGYFNNGSECSQGPFVPAAKCGFPDVLSGKGGFAFGDGKVIGGTGKATFSGSVKVGDTPDLPIPGSVEYNLSDSPYFVVVVRSKGPKVPGHVNDQIHTIFGGCVTEVGPPAGSAGTEFSIPAVPGECGDVQAYSFDTDPG